MSITLDEICLDANTSNVAISDGTNTLSVNADGSLNVTISDPASIPIDDPFGATPDALPIAGIRQDAGGSPVSADGDAHPLVFNNSGELKVAANLSSSVGDDDPYTEMPIAVGGRGVSGALTALSATNDKFDLLGDLYRRVWVNTSSNIAMNVENDTIGATQSKVLSTPLSGRRSVTIQNVDPTNDVYMGFDATVTTSNGIKIPKKSSATYDIGPDIDIHLIASGAGTDVRLLELA